MPRTARHIESNAFYHIISRSINEMWSLKDQEDFNYFHNLIYRAKKKFPIRLFHYVLMNTHFHFVLQTIRKDDLSPYLGYIKWYYTKWAQRKYSWKGPFWRERYKNIPIENETYLVACGAYVEANPVRAGICQTPSDYQHSSYKVHHQNKSDKIVDMYRFDPSLAKYIFDVSEETKSLKIKFSRAKGIGSTKYQLKLGGKS